MLIDVGNSIVYQGWKGDEEGRDGERMNNEYGVQNGKNNFLRREVSRIITVYNNFFLHISK